MRIRILKSMGMYERGQVIAVSDLAVDQLNAWLRSGRAELVPDEPLETAMLGHCERAVKPRGKPR